MKDRDFLKWVHDRMIYQHDESPYYDYMHKLRSIIKATPEDQETPNVASNPDE